MKTNMFAWPREFDTVTYTGVQLPAKISYKSPCLAVNVPVLLALSKELSLCLHLKYFDILVPKGADHCVVNKC